MLEESPPSTASQSLDNPCLTTESADDATDRAIAKLCRTLCRHLREGMPTDVGTTQTPEALRQSLDDALERLLAEESATLSDDAHDAVLEMLINDIFEYGPITTIMRDPDISDVLINGPFQTFIEKRGQLIASEVTFDDESHLLQFVQRMVRRVGRELNTSSPMVDVRLLDGSRMNAILTPPAINGPIVSIRRFGSRPLTADDLVEKESLTHDMLDFLKDCVRCRCNIVISGGTGSGKTTLLNALSRFIRPSERIATIEDTAELELQQPHVVKFEACGEHSNGSTAITMRTLMRNSLRIRPDRIIIGECRGPEILEMLQAMNTGHEGSMTTIHANSPREALYRIEMMVALGGVDISLHALRRQMAASITFIIQVARLLGGQRKVVKISEITGMEGDVITMHDIFRFEQTASLNDVAVGRFEAIGIRPACYERLIAGGAETPIEVFRATSGSIFR